MKPLKSHGSNIAKEVTHGWSFICKKQKFHFRICSKTLKTKRTKTNIPVAIPVAKDDRMYYLHQKYCRQLKSSAGENISKHLFLIRNQNRPYQTAF